MGRWEPDARGRLASAALELYGERGFEQTTVAEIAERAGLTERTFFRHFADKREVLFSGSTELRDLLVTTAAAAPSSSSPLGPVVAAFEAAGRMFEGRWSFARRRQAAVAANPDLQERELAKMASLSAALAATLRDRGVAEPTASLCAEAGIAVFKVAFEQWVSSAEESDLAAVITASFAELGAVTAPGSPSPGRPASRL